MRRVWSVPLLLIWLLRLVISVLVRILWLVLWVVPTAILAHIIALPILFGPALGLIGEWIGIRPLLDARPMKALRAARFHAIFWFRTAPARFILDRAALLPLAVFVATVVPTIFTLFAPELLPQPSGRLSGGLSLRHREYIGIAWVVVTALVAMVGIVRERQQRAEDREEAADLKDLDPSDLQLLAPRLALVAQTISPQSLHALGVPPDFGWVVHIYGYGKKRLMPILPRPISDPNSGRRVSDRPRGSGSGLLSSEVPGPHRQSPSTQVADSDPTADQVVRSLPGRCRSADHDQRVSDRSPVRRRSRGCGIFQRKGGKETHGASRTTHRSTARIAHLKCGSWAIAVRPLVTP